MVAIPQTPDSIQNNEITPWHARMIDCRQRKITAKKETSVFKRPNPRDKKKGQMKDSHEMKAVCGRNHNGEVMVVKGEAGC